jgi:hypothetical protein
MSDGADHSFLFFVSFHLTCKPPLKKREKNSRSFQLGVYVRFDALFFFLFHMCRCFPSLFMFLSFSSYALFFPFFFCECRSAVFRWLGKWRGERPFASVFFFLESLLFFVSPLFFFASLFLLFFFFCCCCCCCYAHFFSFRCIIAPQPPSQKRETTTIPINLRRVNGGHPRVRGGGNFIFLRFLFPPLLWLSSFAG